MVIIKSSLAFLWHSSIFILNYCFSRKRLPVLLNSTLVKLGPVYIKLGQVLSTRRESIPEKYIKELSELCDNVPYEKPAIMRKALEKAFPQGIDKVFSNLPENPIASGAVAQVYEANLLSGEKVAVKVLRPGIRKSVEENFIFINFLIKIGEFFSKTVRVINIRGIVHELEHLLLSQTDLTEETRNFKKFREVFQDEPNLTVPKVYEELSSPQVMVTEFVEAIHPYDYKQLDIDPVELASRADNLLDTMLFIKGFCHADLHPGNFFWNKKGELVLIDFGLVHYLTEEDRNKIGVFYFSVVEGFYDFATHYFIDHFVISSDPENSKLEQEREEVYKKISVIIHRSFKERVEFSDMFQKLLQVMGAHHLCLRANYSKLFLTLVTVEGYILMLNPKFDMVENTRKKKLMMAEYASMPEEAEEIIFDDFATYSTAMFRDGCSVREAFQKREDYILDILKIKENDFVIDVGCGRGGMLEAVNKRGGKSLGITISRTESEVCQKKGLNCIWSSWEEFDEAEGADKYPKADSIIVVEILVHLATYFENRAGLLDIRLEKFFAWLHAHVKEGGQVYLQALTVTSEFINGTKEQEFYEKLTSELPMVGAVTFPQLVKHSDPYFIMKEARNDSEDLLATYNHFNEKIKTNAERLSEIMSKDMYHYVTTEMDLLMELAETKMMNLHRLLLVRKPD